MSRTRFYKPLPPFDADGAVIRVVLDRWGAAPDVHKIYRDGSVCPIYCKPSWIRQFVEQGDWVPAEAPGERAAG